jgi:hypothetical protein
VNSPHLNDQLVLHKKVNTVSTIEPDVFAFYRQWVLELKGESIAIQLMNQTLFVGGFQQSWPELPVNFDGTADHAMREIVEFHLRALRVLRGSCLSFTEFSTL